MHNASELIQNRSITGVDFNETLLLDHVRGDGTLTLVSIPENISFSRADKKGTWWSWKLDDLYWVRQLHLASDQYGDPYPYKTMFSLASSCDQKVRMTPNAGTPHDAMKSVSCMKKNGKANCKSKSVNIVSLDQSGCPNVRCIDRKRVIVNIIEHGAIYCIKVSIRISPRAFRLDAYSSIARTRNSANLAISALNDMELVVVSLRNHSCIGPQTFTRTFLSLRTKRNSCTAPISPLSVPTISKRCTKRA
jgi:hypothetical protein